MESPHPSPVKAAHPDRDARRAVADGLVLAHDLWSGQHATPPLLYLHGFGQTRHAWRTTAARLRDAGFGGMALDGRGHGDSDWNPPSQAYAMEQFVDDVIEVSQTLQVEGGTRPILVGASMGGLLGLLAEGESREGLFSALIMVDVTPRWESQGVERILDFMGAHPQGFESLEAASNAIASYLPHRRRRKSPRELASLLVRRDDGRFRWHWDPRLLDEVARDGERYQTRLMQAATQIRIPTLLVSGGMSDVVSAATVDEFLALVPHAVHTRIADATHMVAGDRNDAFAGAILEFLAAMGPRIAPSRGAAS